MTEDSRAHKNQSPSQNKNEARPDASSPAPPAADWLLIGEVVGIFGVRGEIKVRPETDFPERFAQTPALYLGAQRARYVVAGARVARPNVVVRLEGVPDANAAERLRGLLVYVPAAEAVALPADRYYQHDLIGLRVVRPEGEMLGSITDVLTGPANDVLVVRAERTGQEVLVPAIKEMVKRVDLAAGIVVLDPIPGLFDANFETAG